MTPSKAEAQDLAPNLTIGDLARETGLTPPVLRAWESRHGFPRPARLESGHRRYSREQVALVRQVLRRKDAGIRLEVAIAEVLASTEPDRPSVFATLRRRHPQLAPSRLRKSTLLALSWALEDHCCALADSPVLFGAFQRQRYWEPAEARWTELARVARSTMVFADFEAVADVDPGGRPTRVPLGAAAPMRREWVVACDSPTHSACLSAWELPGQHGVPQKERLFEAMWTIDPHAVRDATRVCAAVAAEAAAPGAAALQYALADEPSARFADPVGATALFNRVVEYVDRLG